MSRPGLVGAPLRAALSDGYDEWLQALLPPMPGVALVAAGGLGRREPAPYSDLDLVLLHDGRVPGLSRLADSIWYPIWDGGLSLDHSVRTVQQAVSVAKDDLKALLGLLYVRHLGGDPELSRRLRERVLELWRAVAVDKFAELYGLCQQRWDVSGDAAFLLEPHLKQSRGGLRDGHAIQALALAQLVDLPRSARDAYTTLLDVRGELHRVARRDDDVLRLQEHDAVAQALGVVASVPAGDWTDPPAPDREALLRSVNQAARVVAHALDGAARRVRGVRERRRERPRLFAARAADPARLGLAPGVVAQDGEVVLARDAEPSNDPCLMLRAARAAAEHDLPLAPFMLDRLAAEAAPLPQPWPDQARTDFVALLGAGPAAVPVLETLDLAGLLVRLLPEWDAVRCRAQYNPVHRFTVDRHLLETAAHAAGRAADVPRPDLLLVGALLHDIGKGYPGGDHSVIGADRAELIATRMGFAAEDAATIVALVRHHLLLPDTATRRDPDDPQTISAVADVVGGSSELLTLLHALTIADAAATGPDAWSEWKAGLVDELVTRTRARLHGAPPQPVPPLDDQRRTLAEAGQLAVQIRDREIVVAAPDTVGVLYRTAGVLALHSLDVRSASIRTHAAMAVNAFVVEPRFGRLPDPALVRTDLARALDGQLGLDEKLAAKERAYAGSGPARERRAPTVHWFDDAATAATVLEYRGQDGIGLLFRVTRALERCGLDVRSARVSSLGGVVVDAFYVTVRGGGLVPAGSRPLIEQALTGT